MEEQPVITRPAVPQGIPVGAGLSESDDVIVDGGNVKVGQAVRVRRQSQ